MSIPGHVHHVAPFISIYDPVTFADVQGSAGFGWS